MTRSGAAISESSSDDWRLASRLAVAGVIVIAGVHGALLDTGLPDLFEFLLGAATGALIVAMVAVLIRVALSALRSLPASLLASAVVVLLALLVLDAWSMAEIWRTLLAPDDWSWPVAVPGPLSVAALFALVCAVTLSVIAMRRARHDSLDLVAARGGLALFTVAGGLMVVAFAMVVSLVIDGRDPFPTQFRTFAGVDGSSPAARALGDPTAPGAFRIETLSYGAGENERRPDFDRDRDLESRTVDASKMLPEWKGIRGEMREAYWGFGLDAAPLNGLVWAPEDEGEGAGPLPLVLIVHGNHGMEDYSDAGYRYLGELLASRGYIAVSVDENYINGSWSGDFRGKEMPLRAWLLLEHLALWRDWAATPGHPFEGRVDLSRIALVGHSRGGEAVSIAHAFNDLPHYPDDATVAFDYGFDIRALVAVAQVDQRYHRRVELSDVDFLALQGSYDSDEPAFHGLRQFNRITLTGDADHFKAGLYLHRANHGQFNSSWGRSDYSPPGSWLLNLAPIMAPEGQRQIASAYISAFLDASLRGDAASRLLLRDPRRGAAWLPDEIYVNQFTDSSFVPVADFEEDLDVLTAALPEASIHAEDLAVWREEDLLHRDGREQGTNVAVLGWRAGSAPVFGIRLPEGLPDPIGDGDALLTLTVTASPEEPPKEKTRDEDGEGSTAEGATDAAEDDAVASEDESSGEQPDPKWPEAPRFAIELVTASGRIASIGSDAVAALAPPLRVRYLKSARANAAAYESDWEAVLQVLEVPLARFGVASEEVRDLRLRFDGETQGAVIIDDIGVRALR